MNNDDDDDDDNNNNNNTNNNNYNNNNINNDNNNNIIVITCEGNFYAASDDDWMVCGWFFVELRQWTGPQTENFALKLFLILTKKVIKKEVTQIVIILTHTWMTSILFLKMFSLNWWENVVIRQMFPYFLCQQVFFRLYHCGWLDVVVILLCSIKYKFCINDYNILWPRMALQNCRVAGQLPHLGSPRSRENSALYSPTDWVEILNDTVCLICK